LKEKMVVLGIAEPHRSTKYELAICVAGITIHGRFRRIYSVPMKYYINRVFKKYQYIKYDLVGRGGDTRPESMRADMSSIEPLEMASPSTIARLIRENLSTSFEYLQERKERSLGIVEPWEIDSCIAEYNNNPTTGRFTMMRGAQVRMNLLPTWMRIRYSCRPYCGIHYNICEDMELGNQFRRQRFQSGSRSEAIGKVTENAENFLHNSNPCFLVGTHIRWRTWLIISIINRSAEHLYSLSHIAD
jgi:hypothetical protein